MKTIEILRTVMPRHGTRAVVLCDGPRPPMTLLANCLDEAELFICTDMAGWPHEGLPRPPDVVVGDFDTLGPPPPSSPSTTYLHRPEQNTTDSEKALKLAGERGCEEALLLGATGGLLDHSLANIALSERFADRLRIALVDDSCAALRIGAGREVVWTLPPQTIISLLPLGAGACVQAFTGVNWPLHDVELTGVGPTTISNHVVTTPVRLKVAAGSVLVVIRSGRQA